MLDEWLTWIYGDGRLVQGWLEGSLLLIFSEDGGCKDDTL